VTGDYPVSVYDDAALDTDPADQPPQRLAPMTAARHEQVARDLDVIAWSYELRARPFRARAEEHRQAARHQRGEA
jgi:hypothetical protein